MDSVEVPNMNTTALTETSNKIPMTSQMQLIQPITDISQMTK